MSWFADLNLLINLLINLLNDGFQKALNLRQRSKRSGRKSIFFSLPCSKRTDITGVMHLRLSRTEPRENFIARKKILPMKSGIISNRSSTLSHSGIIFWMVGSRSPHSDPLAKFLHICDVKRWSTNTKLPPAMSQCSEHLRIDLQSMRPPTCLKRDFLATHVLHS
jgi:hypothetical protein